MFWFRLFNLTTKKYLHTILYAIIGAIVPLIIIGTIVFYAYKSFNENEPLIKGRVGVVAEDINDDYMEYAMNYLENMSSTSESLEFITMSQAKANKALNNNDIVAIIYIPAGIVNGILYGENIPAEITFNNNSSLSSVILAEITNAGVRMLSGAQAGTYTVSELYYSLGCDDQLYDAYNDVDLLNFAFVLTREDSFDKTDLTFGDINRTTTSSKRFSRAPITNPLLNYFTASAILIFLMISGASFIKFFQSETDSFYSLLKCKPFAITVHSLYTFIIYFTNILLITLLFFIVLSKNSNFNFELSARAFLYIIISSLLISSFTYMLMNISSSVFAKVIVIFLSSLLFPFMAGAIIPVSFIPDSITSISNVLPFASIHRLYIGILSGVYTVNLMPLFIWIAIFIIIATIFNYLRIRRG